MQIMYICKDGGGKFQLTTVSCHMNIEKFTLHVLLKDRKLGILLYIFYCFLVVVCDLIMTYEYMCYVCTVIWYSQVHDVYVHVHILSCR